MKEQRPETLQEARQQARRRRRRRLMIIRTAIVLAAVLLLLLVGALVVMKIVGTQQSKRGETTGFLAVREIQVEGETRYTPEQIIEKSGLYVGQSLMGVNKVQACDALIEAFPYLNSVEIGNTSFDTLHIRVGETEVMGVVETDEGWTIVGENNHALEHVTADQLVEGMLRIRGAVIESNELGEKLLDERSLRVCRTLVAAANLYGLDSMTTIDMTHKTNLCLLLNERLQVLLGNESNLAEQIAILVDTLPTLLKNNGENASGRFDMTAYADEDPNNDKGIYTPPELLEKEEPDTSVDTSDGEVSDASGVSADEVSDDSGEESSAQ